MSANSGGKLVVAELPIHPNKLKAPIQWNKYVDENGSKYPLGATTFQSLIYGDTFTMVEMDPAQGEVSPNEYLLISK